MFREIAVKTLTGKGKLENYINKTISLDSNVSKTLVCWIINFEHQVEIINSDIFTILFKAIILSCIVITISFYRTFCTFWLSSFTHPPSMEY